MYNNFVLSDVYPIQFAWPPVYSHFPNSVADVGWIPLSITRIPSVLSSALVFKLSVLLKTIQLFISTVKCWRATVTLPAHAASRAAPVIVDEGTRSLVLRALRCTRCLRDQSNSRRNQKEKLTKKVIDKMFKDLKI